MTPQNIHVTAIICTKGRAGIQEVVRQLQVQTRPPDTLIIITDTHIPAIKGARVIVAESSIGAARNIGLLAAPPETTHIWWVDDDVSPGPGALDKMLDAGVDICTNRLIPWGEAWWRAEQKRLNRLQIHEGIHLYAPMSSYLIRIEFCTVLPPTVAGEDVFQNIYALSRKATFATTGYALHIQRLSLTYAQRVRRRVKHLWGAINSMDLSGGWGLRPTGKGVSPLGAATYAAYRAKYWATIARGVIKSPWRKMGPRLSAYFELGRVDMPERWASNAVDALVPGLGVLEVGAGMGGTSKGVGSRHIHIEANPDLIPHLRRRHPGCEIINARYGDAYGDGKGDYTNQSYHGGGGVNLDGLPGGILIMDCEGSERHLVKEDLSPFVYVILEVHLEHVDKNTVYESLSKTHCIRVVYWDAAVEIVVASRRQQPSYTHSAYRDLERRQRHRGSMRTREEHAELYHQFWDHDGSGRCCKCLCPEDNAMHHPWPFPPGGINVNGPLEAAHEYAGRV